MMRDESLLVIVLADVINQSGRNVPLLNVKHHGLPVCFVQETAKHFGKSNAVVVFASSDGQILDLKDAHPPKNIAIKHEKGRPFRALSSNIGHLRGATSALKDDQQFTNVLVTGNLTSIGDNLNISRDLTQSLKDFIAAHTTADTRYRVQICNFATRQVEQTGENFVDTIIPNRDNLSIPQYYSIISPTDNRAIDLRCSPFDFDALKKPLRSLLTHSNKDEDLPEKIKEVINRLATEPGKDFFSGFKISKKNIDYVAVITDKGKRIPVDGLQDQPIAANRNGASF